LWWTRAGFVHRSPTINPSYNKYHIHVAQDVLWVSGLTSQGCVTEPFPPDHNLF